MGNEEKRGNEFQRKKNNMGLKGNSNFAWIKAWDTLEDINAEKVKYKGITFKCIREWSHVFGGGWTKCKLHLW